MTFFSKTIQTLEELKKEYHRLAMVHHPDIGGDLEKMKRINAEYDELFEIVKNWRTNSSGEVYTKETDETPDEYRDLINALFEIKMQGVVIEIIGTFVWLTGDTKPYKDAIKGLGFRWSENKMAWYKSPPGYRKRSKKDYSINDIRAMFESTRLRESESKKQLSA